MACVCDGMVCSHVGEGKPAICNTWVKVEGIMLREVSQTEEDKDCVISLTNGFFFLNSQVINTESRLMVTRPGGGRVGEMVCKAT